MNIDVSFKKGNSNIGAQIKQEDKSFVVDFSKNEAGFDIKSSNEESSFLAELSQEVRQVPAEFSEKIIVIGQYTDNPIIVKLQQTNDGVLITVTDKTGAQYGVIKNGHSGAPGYTPVKGVDYFDGESGKDGVTPHIGSNGNWHTGEVDTGVAATGPEGKPGADGSHGKDGYTPVKGVDYFDGKDGKDGVDGYTPQKGIDYFDGEPFTYEDLTEEQILELKGADSWNSLKDKPFGDENVQRYCTIVDHQWSANRDFSDVYFQYEATELNGYTIGNGFSGGEEVNVVINDTEYSGVVFTDESYSCVGDSAYTTVPFYIISSEIDARCVIKIKPDLVPAKVTVYRDVVEIKTIDPKYLPEGTNGVTPHVGDNGNWFVGDTDTGKPSRGAPGEDGGYYKPNVTQPNDTTIEISFTPSKDCMELVEPTTINLPASEVVGDYVTEEELEQKGFAKKSDIPTDYIKEIPPEYVTEQELSAKGYAVKEDIPVVPQWAMQPQKPTYSATEVGSDQSGTAESKVSEHNVNTSAHNDIRVLLSELTNRLNALADSDDTTLDQMSEIVAYIKSNKGLIEAVTTEKVSYTDIIDNLVTNLPGKPLSAAQGVVLKALIDAIDWDNLKGKPFGEETAKSYLTIVDHEWSTNRDFLDVYFQYEATELSGYTIGNGLVSGEEVTVAINGAEYRETVFADGNYCCVGDPTYAAVPFYIASSEADVRCSIRIKPDLVPVNVSAYRDVVNVKTIDPKYLPAIPSEYVTEQELSEKGYALKSDVPTVPKNVSAFTNDAGYLTQHQDISGKLDADKLPQAIDTALAQAKESGEFEGDPGYTPQKGKDYWTDADKNEIVQQTTEKINVPTKTSELTNDSGYQTLNSLKGTYFIPSYEKPTSFGCTNNDDLTTIVSKMPNNSDCTFWINATQFPIVYNEILAINKENGVNYGYGNVFLQKRSNVVHVEYQCYNRLLTLVNRWTSVNSYGWVGWRVFITA